MSDMYMYNDMYMPLLKWHVQKQLSEGVYKKKCSENIQQIYRRIPVLKWDFNKSHFGMGAFL